MSNAAAAVAGDLLAEAAAEGGLADEPDVEIEAGADVEVEAEEETPLFPDIPDEIESLLAEDDEPEDDDPEDEPPAAAWDEEFAEPDAENYRIQAHRAEKKAENLEKQLLSRGRKEWAEEIGRVFPLADPGVAANASSRKAALRAAKAEHDIAKKGADRVAAHYETNIEKIVAERVAAESEKLRAAWGSPIEGPGGAPAEAAAKVDKQEAIQNASSLQERIQLKVRNGLLNI